MVLEAAVITERGKAQQMLVVLFSGRDHSELAYALNGVTSVRLQKTDDCYAAAADLLVSPQAILIADVTSIRKDQLGLLSMAKRLGVSVFALGQAPQSMPELASLPAVSAENIRDILAETLVEETGPQPEGASPESLEVAEQAEVERQQEQEDENAPPATQHESPSELLSPEEIAALLEGGQ